MIAVVFEVWPASGRKEDYLAIAATLRPELEKIDGFISVERFQSLTDPGKLLSLSFWRDEEAVQRWRNEVHHRESQATGRAGIFADCGLLQWSATTASRSAPRRRRTRGRFTRRSRARSA